MSLIVMPAIIAAKRVVLEPSWPDSDGYIYDEGKHEDEWEEGLSQNSGDQSKESDHLYVEAEEDGTRTWRTKNPVDLMGIKDIEFLCSYDNDEDCTVYLRVAETKTGSSAVQLDLGAGSGEDETKTLKVSDLNETSTGKKEYYIRCKAQAMKYISGYYAKLWLYSVKLIEED